VWKELHISVGKMAGRSYRGFLGHSKSGRKRRTGIIYMGIPAYQPWSARSVQGETSQVALMNSFACYQSRSQVRLPIFRNW
jgi:hypothetical protein